MNRYRASIVAGVATLASLAVLLFSSFISFPLLMLTAGGAPLTVLLLVKAVTDPTGGARRLWPSLLIGATFVPAIVIGLHGLFYAIGFALVEPFANAGEELLERVRADDGIVGLLTDYWAYIFIAELAIIAPLAEETTKPLASLVRRPATARDAFLFGAAAGTGFAIVENVLYASGWFWSYDYWLSISTLRMLGAGLHAFGAALVSWGLFQLRDKEPGRWLRLAAAFGFAFAAHSLWNGTIAVTQVIYAGRSEFGANVLSDDALAWGVAMQAFLAAIGGLVVAGLLLGARKVRDGGAPIRFDAIADLARPRGIAAWAILSTALLIPSTITVLVFPELVAL